MPRIRFVRSALLRTVFFLVGDLCIWTVALVGAFEIRFDGAVPPRYQADIPLLLALFIPVKLLWHWVLRLYRMTWRTVSLPELMNTIKAAGLSALTIGGGLFFFRFVDALERFPRSVLIMDFVFSLGGVGLFRVARRLWRAQFDRQRAPRSGQGVTRILIVGAGAAGVRLAQGMQDSPHNHHRIVGFADDDPAKWGTYIQGLRVLGGREAMPEIVGRHAVDEVLIAIPSAPSREIRAIVEWVRRAGVKRMRILPGVHELLTGRATLKDIRDVEATDLLGRASVTIATDVIARQLEGSRVLVTGAAGSIGSEVVRQIARLAECEIIALDANETGLFELEENVRQLFPGVQLRTMVADVRDAVKMDWLLGSATPRIIYHAAAYKHVPLMERDADEAVKTNVFGMLVLAEAAVRHGVETFVFVSTDKAVRPTSIMGATKRVGELIAHVLSLRGRTRFLVVRFGNVLGSRGSLVPVIQDQIRRGGPVTLTHPEMTRYFMSAAEAVLLVLQASMADRQHALYVLDMGEPVRIADLAAELIRLSGLEPDKDIPIVYTGIRPGEKLEEELAAPFEAMTPSPFPGIREVSEDGAPDEVTLRLAVQQLEHLVARQDADGIRAILRHLASEAISHPGAPVGGEAWTRVAPSNPASP